MSLRLASIEDVPRIMEIIGKVIPKMHSAGNYQWDETYPNETRFEEDIEAGTLYVFEEEGMIKGCVVADNHHPFSYDDIPWELARFDAAALHRLAVDTDFQGQGLARKMITEIGGILKEKGFYGIHTDTSLENKAMQQLFDTLGYVYKGQLNLDDNLDRWYVAYEKVF